MKRTTIFIDESVERELRLVARRRGRSVAAVVRDAIAREVAAEVRPPLSFVGVGDSGRSDIAERHEELLWKGFEPPPLQPRRSRVLRSRARAIGVERWASRAADATAAGHRDSLRVGRSKG